MSENNGIKNKWVKFLIYAAVTILPWVIIFAVSKVLEKRNEPSEYIKIVNYEKKEHQSPVDHGEFEELQKEFKTPMEVTEACVSCHNKRHTEIMSNAHWTWDRERLRENGETVLSGKRNVINNFCIATNTNTWKCTSCHIGFGYKDNEYDFSDYTKVDCMVCHDLTGAYEKEPLGSGFPADERQAYSDKTYFPPNYNYIAANVGSPDVENCGKCHFFGGGGDNVKHGDLSSDLYHPDKKMDVHMDIGEDGNGMTCIDCHKTENHEMLGKLYSLSSSDEGRLMCSECHEGEVHQNNTLNRHSNRVACQTCHIPEYAKGVPTKMVWDWSTTGRVNEDGSFIKEHDSLGNVTYKTPKGSFEWATHVTPEYVWFNGTGENSVYGDIIQDTTQVLKINKLNGSYDDPKAQIIPVKVHRGKQIFDPVNKMLIVPHVYGKDSTAYGVGLNWDLAAKKGMKEAGLPYSGKYSFIETEMYWPLNHMVSPNEDALKCIDCHSQDGRLASLDGFYMPGRDQSNMLDMLGIGLIFAAIGGVIIHGGIRFMKR